MSFSLVLLLFVVFCCACCFLLWFCCFAASLFSVVSWYCLLACFGVSCACFVAFAVPISRLFESKGSNRESTSSTCTFYVYFNSKSCFWWRSVLGTSTHEKWPCVCCFRCFLSKFCCVYCVFAAPCFCIDMCIAFDAYYLCCVVFVGIAVSCFVLPLLCVSLFLLVCGFCCFTFGQWTTTNDTWTKQNNTGNT